MAGKWSKFKCNIVGHNVDNLRYNKQGDAVKQECSCCGLTRSLWYHQTEGDIGFRWMYTDPNKLWDLPKYSETWFYEAAMDIEFGEITINFS